MILTLVPTPGLLHWPLWRALILLVGKDTAGEVTQHRVQGDGQRGSELGTARETGEFVSNKVKVPNSATGRTYFLYRSNHTSGDDCGLKSASPGKPRSHVLKIAGPHDRHILGHRVNTEEG